MPSYPFIREFLHGCSIFRCFMNFSERILKVQPYPAKRHGAAAHKEGTHEGCNWQKTMVGLSGWRGLAALVGAGFLCTCTTIPVPVPYAETNLNDELEDGDQSGSLVGLDPEGKFTQAFPPKHADVSIF